MRATEGRTRGRRRRMKKMAVSLFIGVLILLLFLPHSPSTVSSQIGFALFISALGVMIFELWVLIPEIKVKHLPRARRIIRPITAMSKERKICIVVALVLTSVFACISFRVATEVHGTRGYTSDETWYASSARNILREVFGVQPSYVDPEGRHHYTVFFSSRSELNAVREKFTDFIERELHGEITYVYEKTAGMSIAIPEELDCENLLETFPRIKIIQRGYDYPDADAIENYLNMEHPPLVKYLIGFSMLALGDQPISWRIPGIIAGSLTVLFVYLIVAKLIKHEIIALFVYLLAFTDPVMMAMSSVAMLDIYVAFFITLSIWFALRKNYFLSALAIGFASSCKLTGVFSIAGLFFFMVVLRKPGVKKVVLCATVVPLLVWFLFNSPLILRFGFQRWSEDLGRGLAWHVTSRPPGPVVSTPWGWFVNENPFALNFGPDISASVNSVVYVMALISVIFIPYLARKVSLDYLIPSFWLGFTFLGYVAVYLLGNRTLYSFYVVSLSPMVYILACVLIYHIIRAVQEHFKT